MRERLPHTRVQRRSTGNPDKESFEGSLAHAEEGFSDQIRRVEILSKASVTIYPSYISDALVAVHIEYKVNP
ncbi:hypothetical protein Taro_016043 [Colocasia esculenta]|uniref:Uncharacterized protein n=1 Tax=Colocasia esculenta TaxID=4460 RepID=A0A843UMT2_COLES|nr:hypothetical protein [Colocasia esculenta]